ncbi:membrane protein [Cytophagales bacterium WSM2-2]|nr:membrane protein [Cytophagales bacterium WSM2-2]
MKKVNFGKDVVPHLAAVVAFLIITLTFFSPLFFDNKALAQHDIQQFLGSSKSIIDYRKSTGEEALWAPSMFSGMPAYLVSVQWGNAPVAWVKRLASLYLPSPVNNIFLAFLCYYIMLLAFRVRPYLAMAGAISFGLSSYMVIGLGAGHNARIAAIAFLPLIMAGIHLAFSGKRWLGFATTMLGLALHLRENHLQMTYYFVLIVSGYGLIQLIWAYREKKIKEFFTNAVILIPAVAIAAGTFFGQFWAITEYTRYSIRGPSELSKPDLPAGTDGLSKARAFEYNDGIGEPMTLFIPDFYGRNASYFFVEDQSSESYKALANSGDNQLANRLANYTYAYAGDTGAAYYGGAIIVFLFVIGILLVDKKWLWWVLPLSVLSVLLSWGANFSAFNYFMFDYFPGYNKFRSVTFAMIIILFLMPLLGMIGVEKLLTDGLTKENKKKVLIAIGVTGGLCLLVILFAGMGDYSRPGESQLPAWFTKALQADRRGLVRADAFRSLGFILPVFVMLYFDLGKKLSELGVLAFIALLVTLDMSFVDKRYFGSDKYQRKYDTGMLTETGADAAIRNDKNYFRVYNLQNAWAEARTSYFHNSLGGYHGAKLRYVQDLYDSCIQPETQRLIANVQKGNTAFTEYGVLNMLNAKYLVYGPDATNIIQNTSANGNAWFVKEVIKVSTANEELKKTGEINTTDVAVTRTTLKNGPLAVDSAATIKIAEFNPRYLKYESQSSVDGIAVFSEIYYPKGWLAYIDGKESEIFRVNYVLRSLAVPAGKHTIEFKFEPRAYVVGNKVTAASSWVLLLIALGCFGWTLKKES